MEQKRVIRVQGLFGEVIWTIPPEIAKNLIKMKRNDEKVLKIAEIEDSEAAELLKEKFNGSTYKMFDEEFTRMLKAQFALFAAMLSAPPCFLLINQEVAESTNELSEKILSFLTETKKTPPY